VALNPGNLDSVLYLNVNPAVRAVLRRLVLHPTIFGAYTVLLRVCRGRLRGRSWGRVIGVSDYYLLVLLDLVLF